MPLSLDACFPMSDAPVQIVSPGGTLQVETAVPATISVTPLAFSQEVLTPTLTRSPIGATKTSEEIKEIPMAVTQPLTITVIYDNNRFDPRLSSAWGFSALVEYRQHTLLFDTGGDGKILMANIRLLGFDPAHIEGVVLSHIHGDHTGGLTSLNTGAQPAVYLLPSFPASFKRQIEHLTTVIEVSSGQSLAEGFWTTGEMGSNIREQALVIQTEQGLVVVTGCAHPGVVSMVEQAQRMFSEPVRLVLGGFHLSSKTEADIRAIVKDFRRLGVEQVAPCHCTGERALAMFAAEYGQDFIQIGVGSVIELDVAGR